MSSPNQTGNHCHRTSTRTGTTRRHALNAIMFGTAGILISPQVLAGFARERQSRMLQLDSAQWTELIGQSFLATDENLGVVHSLRLEEVFDDSATDANKPAGLRDTAISLVFSGDQKMENATYQLRHPTLGSENLFIHATRRGAYAEKLRYQVVVN